VFIYNILRANIKSLTSLQLSHGSEFKLMGAACTEFFFMQSRISLPFMVSEVLLSCSEKPLLEKSVKLKGMLSSGLSTDAMKTVLFSASP
jgi:hypothetical protein